MRYSFFILIFLNVSFIFANKFPLYDFLDTNWIAGEFLHNKKALFAECAPIIKPVQLAETLNINYKPDQPNPLLNQKPLFFKNIHGHHLFVIESKPADIYLIDVKATDSTATMLSVTNLQDACLPASDKLAHTSSGIVGLDLGVTSTDEKHLSGYFFAAVKPHDGSFGQEGSGLAIIKITADELIEKIKNEKGKEEEKKKKQVVLSPLDAITGQKNGNRAYPIDMRDSKDNPLSVNGGLGSILNEKVDVYWSRHVNRLYISLCVRTKETASMDQGSCGILVGTMGADKIEFKPLSTVFYGSNQIVGATGPDQEISIHKTRILFTSTGLTYLIVVGGNGSPEKTKNLIYALPLVDTYVAGDKRSLSNPFQGHLANKKSKPIRRTQPQKNSRRNSGVTFNNQAISADELYTNQDLEIKVGGNEQLLGALTDIMICGDAIYISVEATENSLSGIFYSQPIFDGDGFIVAWTPWKRAATSQGTIFGFNADIHHGALKFFEIDNKNEIHLHKTDWVQAIPEARPVHEREYSVTDPTVDFLNGEFNEQTHGIINLYNFDKFKLPTLDEQEHLLVAIGANKKIAVIKKDEHQLNSMQTVIFCDKVLQDLAPLTCAEIIASQGESKLVVGGVSGVAILQRNNKGWNELADLNALKDFSFKKFLNCRFVKKIVYYGQYLYILTPDALFCSEINKDSVNSTHLINIITKEQLQTGSFTDVCVADDSIILGTTDGLFYKDIIEDVAGNQHASFYPIPMPNGLKEITKLINIESNVGEKNSKLQQVFVLVGSSLANFSSLYRLFVGNGRIDLLRDSYSKGVQGSFMHFANYRTNFATNGLFALTGADRYRHEPFLQIETIGIPAYKIPLRNYITNVHFKKNSFITSIVRDTATGNWLIAGDFGVYSHPWIVA